MPAKRNHKSVAILGASRLDVPAFVALSMLAIACTEPERRVPAIVSLQSGHGQEAEVDAELSAPIIVRVTDASGNPVRDAVVHFQVGAAPPGFKAGAVTPTTVETEIFGRASVRWRLGSKAGTQTLHARLEPAAGGPIALTEVQATARPGAAASLSPVSAPVTAMTVGDTITFVVASTDRFGNPTEPSNVTWQIADPAIAVLRAEGSAPGRTVVLAQAGGTTTLEATVPGASTFRFEIRTFVGLVREIAYESNGRIYLLRADGVTTTDLGPGREPAWSPDGRQIAFTGNAGSSGLSVFEGDAVIYVMNADGSGRRQLTHPTSYYGASQPTWSPDGRKIAFVQPSSEEDDSRAPGALFVMNADGSAQTRVLRTLTGCSITCAGISNPTWSPDGTRIAYSIWGRKSYHASGDVFVVNANGSGESGLASTREMFEDRPSWSPDGRRVAFAASPIIGGYTTGSADIFSMNIDGTGRTRLTNASSIGWSDVDAAWSPGGSIAFLRIKGPHNPGMGFELWVANGDGTDARRVTRVAAGMWNVAWRPTP
jgi:Tol biopolymer transport system component